MKRQSATASIFLLALVLAACASGRLQAPRGLTLEQVQKAVGHALTGDGFRGVEHSGPDPEGQADGKTKAHRPGTAMTLGGVDAAFVYKDEGGVITMSVDCSSWLTLVPLNDTCRALLRKTRQQLALVEQDVVAAKTSKPTPQPGKPTPVVQQPQRRTPFTGRIWALIVGVSDHLNGTWPVLQGARADAEALGKLLLGDSPMGKQKQERIKVVTRQNATRAEIVTKLQSICELAEEGDMIFVYFACHAEAPKPGSDKRYLVTASTQPDKIQATGIERGDILRTLNEAKAQRQMLFLDCCYIGSDAVTRGNTTTSPFESLGIVPSGSAIQRAALTSTQSDEASLDRMPGSEHSPFGYYVLQELQKYDPDGALTAGELHQRIRVKVNEAARQKGKVMVPQVYGDRSLELWRVKR